MGASPIVSTKGVYMTIDEWVNKAKATPVKSDGLTVWILYKLFLAVENGCAREQQIATSGKEVVEWLENLMNSKEYKEFCEAYHTLTN